MKKHNPKIILASTSPRRRELMALLGVPFEAIASDYEEDMTMALAPERLIKVLSQGKADAVSKNHPGAIVVAADTFVVFKHLSLGKPKNKGEAIKMLKLLSGKSVAILTGLTVQRLKPKKKIFKSVKTTVHFRSMKIDEIKAYVDSGEPLDKAGSFAVQGLGAMFIDRLDGEFTGAMGLPLNALIKSLREFRIKVP